MKNKTDFSTTLIIIYLILITVCLAIYHLIILLVHNKDDQAIFSNLLGWSGTMFGTVALLYTFKEWRKQKASDMIANEAKIVAEKMNLQLDTHRGIMLSKRYNEKYNEHLNQLKSDYIFIERKLSFLDKLIEIEYEKKNYNIFRENKECYLKEYVSLKETMSTIHTLENYPVKELESLKSINTEKLFEDYSNANLNMYEILIMISLHRESLEK